MRVPGWRMQCLLGLLAITLEVHGVPLHLDIAVGRDGTDGRLAWDAPVSKPGELEAIAAGFAEQHGLQQGAGCANASCVAKQLVLAMERETIERGNAALAMNSEGANALMLSVSGDGDGGSSSSVTSSTFLGRGNDALWSECGWHEQGGPFAAETPLAAATARSERRMAEVRDGFLAPQARNASAILEELRAAARSRRHLPPIAEADYDIVEVRAEHKRKSRFQVCPASDDPGKSDVILAVAVMSAPGNLGHRMAIRRTWLSLPVAHEELLAVRFFIGLDLAGVSASSSSSSSSSSSAPSRTDDQQRAVVEEELAFGDIAVLDMRDHYLSTPRKVVAMFRWGVERCGAYWVLRSNDDVYLRLGPTLEQLKRAPPVHAYMGLVVDGGSMTVPRPEDTGLSQLELYERHKTWAFTRSDYPSDAVPNFAQGNAFVLSRDLAAEVADVARRPWVRLMADDVFVALLLAKFRSHEIAVRADYDFHGTYTRCHDNALWHFNIHPEHMYDLYHNHIMGYRSCQGIARFCCG